LLGFPQIPYKSALTEKEFDDMAVSVAEKSKCERGAAFSGRKRELDRVKIKTELGVEEITIPAVMYTNYWAILKYMTINHDRRVSEDELARGVDDIFNDEADDKKLVKWTSFKSKAKVRTPRGGVTMEQPAKPWPVRLATNARNLCRIGGKNDYGSRCIRSGHVMRFETDDHGDSYFIFYTKLTEANTAPRHRGRRKGWKERQR
jgi:hypothetical protein